MPLLNRANPWQSYRQVATQTAPPGQLVLMLFDGALRFLQHARSAFNCEDPIQFNEAINNNIQRAQAIFNELNASLNMADGGEFARTMRDLYNYFDRRLQESNLTKSCDGIDEVATRLNSIREAWFQMLQKESAS